jgi:hypothetical protein
MSGGIRNVAALAVGLGLLCPVAFLTAVRGDEPDLLRDVKARMAIEAQRVEKEFTENRAAAYKLVRAATPNYVEAVARLRTVLAMLESDTSVAAGRREQLIATIKWDLDKVKEIAGEARRTTLVSEETARAIRTEARRTDPDRRVDDRRAPISEADRIIGGRGKSIGDSSAGRRDFGDRRVAVMRSVDEAATPIAKDVVFPKNWYELSMRRSASKMTAKEKELMATLNKVISVEMAEFTFAEAIEYLEKMTGQTIVVDKPAVQEAGVTYEGTKINLKMKASTRFVLKRFLADLGLAYIIKNETIVVTSAARAREETTIRTYYLGDLAGGVDVRLNPFMRQLQIAQNVNQIITTITQTIEPKSWQVNNPDAQGTITFDPISMSLVIKQTAEFHFMMGGGH